MEDLISENQFWLILLFVGLMLLCTECGQKKLKTIVGGGRREGQPCAANLEPCGSGLQCYRNVCIVPRREGVDFFGS